MKQLRTSQHDGPGFFVILPHLESRKKCVQTTLHVKLKKYVGMYNLSSCAIVGGGAILTVDEIIASLRMLRCDTSQTLPAST